MTTEIILDKGYHFTWEGECPKLTIGDIVESGEGAWTVVDVRVNIEIEAGTSIQFVTVAETGRLS